MKSSLIYAIAALLCISLTAAVSIDKATQQLVQFGLVCDLEAAVSWDRNLPDLYSESSIEEYSGDAAVQKLKGMHDVPIFSVAYHPQCPHCTNMVGTYKEFAQYIMESNANIEFIAINMSKSR